MIDNKEKIYTDDGCLERRLNIEEIFDNALRSPYYHEIGTLEALERKLHLNSDILKRIIIHIANSPQQALELIGEPHRFNFTPPPDANVADGE